MEFDFYIFVDFSEKWIGYSIITKERLKEILPKISKFSHYRDLRHKKEYLNSIKKRIERDNILSYFVKYKIRELSKNTEIYADVLEFVKQYKNCLIFISIDNRQFDAFKKLVEIVVEEKIVVKKESELVKDTPEYRASLVIDTLLNLERNKER